MKKLTLAALAVALPLSAASAQVCGKHEDFAKTLEKDHGETLAAVGLSNQGHAVQFFLNEKTGSFTVMLSRPDGSACLVDAGQGAARVKAKAKGMEM